MPDKRRAGRDFGRWMLAAAACWFAAVPALAQPDSVSMLELDGVVVPAPREFVHAMDLVRQGLAGGEPTDAVTTLGQWLRDQGEGSLPEDYLMEAPSEPRSEWVSLRVMAERLLLEMGPEAREIYQLQFGAVADQLLQQAISERREDLLVAVARQYLATDAGRRAVWMLARKEFEQARPASALRWLIKLDAQPPARSALEPQLSLMLASCYDAIGNEEQSRATLARLWGEQPDVELLVAGQRCRVFAAEDASNAASSLVLYRQRDGRVDATSFRWAQPLVASPTPWDLAEHWLNAHGVPSHNAAVRGGAPLLSMQWELPVAVEPAEQAKLEEMSRGYRDQGIPALPILSPLVVDNWLVMRSADAVFGVDFRTGKRVWPYPWDGASLVGNVPLMAIREIDENLGLRLRVWEDALAGQLSSDGEHVFLVQPEHTGASAGDVQMALNAPFMPEVEGQLNELVALELATQGKLKWTVGGISGGTVPELRGAFFLGAPLAVRGVLYAVAEVNSEIRLVALDPATGKMQWSQQLAQVSERPIQLDWTRRLAGVGLTYADGLLICPLHLGAVVAVDVDTRQLRWAFLYGDARDAQAALYADPRSRTGSSDPQSRWLDAVPKYAAGRVVITPADARQWYCLDTLTGTLLGNGVPKGDAIYVVGIHNGNVIVAGKDAIRAMVPGATSSQRVAWEVALPEDSTLSGRGFVSDGHLFQPVTTPALLEIDLDNGKLVRTIDTLEVLGNLTSVGDYVVSQRADKLQVFFRRDRLRSLITDQLQQNAHDPWSLQFRGLLRRDEGDLPGALDDLREAWKLVHERSSSLSDEAWENYLSRQLVATIIQSLEKVDGDGGGGFDDQLWQEGWRLVHREDDRWRLTRIRAEHARGIQQWETAWSDYLSLAGQLADQVGRMAEASYPRDEVRDDWSVRRDRWLRARLAEIYEQADSAMRARLDRAVRDREAEMTDTPRTRQVWADILADLPVGDAITMAVCQDHIERGQLVEAEQRLLNLAQVDRSAMRGWAVYQLARLYVTASRMRAAQRWIDVLQGELGDVVCQDGATGGQLAAGLIEQPGFVAAREASRSGREWPTGEVQVERIPGELNINETRLSLSPALVHRADARVGDDAEARMTLFRRDNTGWGLLITDDLGTSQFEMPLNLPSRAVPRASHWQTYGHLGVVDLDRSGQWLVFDWLTRPDDEARALGSPAASWTFEPPTMSDDSGLRGEAARLRQLQERAIHDAWGSEPELFGRVSGQNFDRLSSGGLCLQAAGNLYAIDPLRREIAWRLQGVADGSWVWGDAEWIWVQQPGEATARRLRRIDGEVVERDVEVPPIERRWFVADRFLLTWRDVPPAEAASDNAGAAATDDADANAAERELQWWDTLAGKPVWTMRVSARTRGAVVGTDRLVLVDKSGKARVIDLGRGQVLSEYTFPLGDETFEDVQVLAWGDRILVCCSRPPLRVVNQQWLWINGWLQCFDARSGAASWTAPATLDSANLVLVQPTGVPLLTFYQQQLNRDDRGRSSGVRLICLDVRDGRVLVDETTGNAGGVPTYFEVDAAAFTINVRLRVSREVEHYRLRFTDNPRPPGVPANLGADVRPARRGGDSAIRVVASVVDALGDVTFGVIVPRRRVPEDVPADLETDLLDEWDENLSLIID